MLEDFISVDWFSAENHSFEYRSCFIPYHFYSEIGKKTGAPRIFPGVVGWRDGAG